MSEQDKIDEIIIKQKLLPGKWKNDHQRDHRRMHDNFVEILQDLNDAFRNEQGIPRLGDGTLDFSTLPVSFLYQWIATQAQKINHSHGDNNVVSPI